MTQCRCDPEVVTVQLFTLATMAVCFAADCKHNIRKDKCRIFRFSSNSKEFKKWENLSRLNSLNDTKVIAIVNKKSLEPHCAI